MTTLQSEPAGARARVPASAAWLGGAGALPFVALALAAVGLDGAASAIARDALAAYGAVILSFLGGVHWGLGMARFGPAGAPDGMARRLVISVLPSLIGWAALFAAPPASLSLLAAAFALMLWLDIIATGRGEAPSWYPALRWPLSAVVVAALLVGAWG